MTRFLVSSTLDGAKALVAKIDDNGRLLYAARGYTVDKYGAIVGRNAATGLEDTKAQRTVTWAAPRQRLDGKWVVLHPENHVSSQMAIDAKKTTAVSAIMDGVVPESIETDPEDGTWFVIPPPPPRSTTQKAKRLV